ncbi:prepilin-type N-terminal cleavage/methylation domain-containing protein [Uliginosibacterium sp. 31-16]|uniref:type IV pilus modification PilV family protein n=1 Tax=Uliginosibacterium sp. 31-16 TaxID=3068315 RepID=UPI00273D6CD2|nr:prepilin-type N-terminal cleavage/methylation domain-containing protein [Uliginosibacterium sp. 31-16]MDP5240236.1 prepilin-type N-terminal cleavage/methylation domain-containing protein [Uliginosibacterium sp. 31-16]
MCTEPRASHAQRGMTLVELVVFIVIVSVGLAGILGVLNLTTRTSADPMLLKQQVAIAESLLEEIESKPFTWCDPDDANVTTAGSATDCSLPQGLGSTTGDARYDQLSPFDNVADYDGLEMKEDGILNPSDGTPIAGLGSYRAKVSISTAGAALGLPADAALQIDVTVGAAGMPDITLTGYRLRYAPNVP